jgi:DNA-binding NarL/FixJ family response regulator
MAERPPQKRQLTSRELEVVRLVVEGASNQEIASRLGVSRRTAQAHVASALAKTGTTSRTALAVFALRHALVPLHPEPEVEGDGD